MANKKKEKDFLDTEEFAKIVAERASFSQSDVREILRTMQEVVEECIVDDVDVDLRGFFHMHIEDMEFKSTPGIIRFLGKKEEDFNKKTKRIIFSTPLNFKKLLRQPKETIISEGEKDDQPVQV